MNATKCDWDMVKRRNCYFFKWLGKGRGEETELNEADSKKQTYDT